MVQVHCRDCGKKISDSAPTCPHCGARQRASKGRFQKDRTTAGILAIFLGSFGVHKFYLGKTGMGILYLIFFWTFIPLIIGVIEGIIYLTKTDEEFEEKYCQ